MPKHDDHIDHRFIIGILQHQDDVLREIYQDFFPRILGYIRKKGGSKEQAYEVLNDAIMTIYHNVKIRSGDFQLTSNFYGYLFGVCKILWLRKLSVKKNKLESIHQQDYERELEDLNNPENILITKELYSQFKLKFSKLSEHCQEILTLRNSERFSYKKIAMLLSINENTAMKRFERCKEKLDDLLRSILV